MNASFVGFRHVFDSEFTFSNFTTVTCWVKRNKPTYHSFSQGYKAILVHYFYFSKQKSLTQICQEKTGSLVTHSKRAGSCSGLSTNPWTFRQSNKLKYTQLRKIVYIYVKTSQHIFVYLNYKWLCKESKKLTCINLIHKNGKPGARHKEISWCLVGSYFQWQVNKYFYSKNYPNLCFYNSRSKSWQKI